MKDPRRAGRFEFSGCAFADNTATLRYAFDDKPELVERIFFPNAPPLAENIKPHFERALRLLHLIAGISYYKAGIPEKIHIAGSAPDQQTADLLQEIYSHGLAEFAHRNNLDLTRRFQIDQVGGDYPKLATLALPQRSLVALGGGKDSLTSVALLQSLGETATAVWIGGSPLIARCAEATGLPQLNIRREISPALRQLNEAGAYNGHVPITAINSAILLVAAILYGFDAIVLSNERSASSPTLRQGSREINHQWSKGFSFERLFSSWVHDRISPNLHYFSLLRPWSELAITRHFAKLIQYHYVFSSCNRNFTVFGARPEEHWCGICPKCHFVFLALAPFMTKEALIGIFGKNYLASGDLAPDFDALLEWNAQKPFECVGEAREAQAAFYALTKQAEWQDDALVARFRREILPNLEARALELGPLLRAHPEHFLPARMTGVLHALG